MEFNAMLTQTETILLIDTKGNIYHRGELVSNEMVMTAIMQCHEQFIKELDNLKSQENNTGN